MSKLTPRVSESEAIKAPNSKTHYTEDELIELYTCSEDPLYFMRNHVKVQHPLKGAIYPEHYPYQEKLIKGFHENQYTIALTGRQLGKCSTSETIIKSNGYDIQINQLINNLTIKQRIISYLEKILLRLSV